jgi:hypothetical protein
MAPFINVFRTVSSNASQKGERRKQGDCNEKGTGNAYVNDNNGSIPINQSYLTPLIPIPPTPSIMS